MKPLKLLESLLLMPRWRSDQPQLFITGVPRSGTTLVYQYIVHRLRVSYFTSAVGHYPRSACVATLWERLTKGAYHSDFDSNHGVTGGHSAPQEARRFWNTVFDFEPYVRLSDVTERKARRMCNTIACIQRCWGNTPFVNKNVRHMLRFEPLTALFPAATFLVVDRDSTDVALSVLRARHAKQGSSSIWWSSRPPDYEAIRHLPPPDQVAMQVLSLKKRMEEDIARLPVARVLRVNYEEFCAKPETLIEMLRSRWTPAQTRHEPVDHFEFRTNKPRTEEESELVRVMSQLSHGHGLQKGSVSNGMKEHPTPCSDQLRS